MEVLTADRAAVAVKVLGAEGGETRMFSTAVDHLAWSTEETLQHSPGPTLMR